MGATLPVAAFLCGLVFALGLGLGGMTQPSKVVGFLDITGAWDPSLAFVMGGALATHALLRRWIVARPAPLLASSFALPTKTDVDRRLLSGAAIFGVGWGLAGFCPGPAIVAAGSGASTALVFVPAMLAGMLAHEAVSWLEARGASGAGAQPRPSNTPP